MIKAVAMDESPESGSWSDDICHASYSGKAMAGLIGEIRKGTFSKDETIVFVHTGGSAALFAYEALFSNRAA